MHACPKKAIVFVVFALVVLTSCQDPPQQQPAVAPEPAVVTIPILANLEAATAEEPKAATAEEPKAATAEEPKAATAGKPKAATAEEPKAATAGKPKAAKHTQKDAAPTGKPESQEKPVVSEPGELQFYSSKGKIDPFQPLIRTERKAVSGAAAKEKKPQRVLTPLERLDLSQIRLVAVVMAESGNIAMVEETSGKGYVVKLGTYMGKNGGRVEKILRDRIVINEIVKNFRGDAVPRSSEMKLHKPEIEG